MKYLEFFPGMVRVDPFLSDIIWLNKAGLDYLNSAVDLSTIRRAIPEAEYALKPGFRISYKDNDVRISDRVFYEPEYRDFGGVWGFDSAISVELTTGHSERMLFSMYYVFDKFMVDFLDFDGKWHSTSGGLRRFLTDVFRDVGEIHYRARKLYSKCCQL